jgi:RimJ/RimL family protein N-acetyltransferase
VVDREILIDATVLTGVVVSLKHVATGQWDLPEWNTNKLPQPDHRWDMNISAYEPMRIMFEALSLALEHHHQSSTPSGDVQRFVGRIENENLAHASSQIKRHANGVTNDAL